LGTAFVYETISTGMPIARPRSRSARPLINSDFGEPVRILVPEGRARRPIAEGPLALQHPTRRDKPRVGRQHGSPQPSHVIAEMVEVNNLSEIVRPVCPAIRVILARPAGWRLTAAAPGAVARRGRAKAAPAADFLANPIAAECASRQLLDSAPKYSWAA
jgi:hypothetical protein